VLLKIFTNNILFIYSHTKQIVQIYVKDEINISQGYINKQPNYACLEGR